MSTSDPKHACAGWCRPKAPWARHSSSCPRTGTLEYAGQFYCKTHHPPTALAKSEDKTAKWRAEWAAERTELQRQARITAATIALVKEAKTWRREDTSWYYPPLVSAVDALLEAEKL